MKDQSRREGLTWLEELSTFRVTEETRLRTSILSINIASFTHPTEYALVRSGLDIDVALIVNRPARLLSWSGRPICPVSIA